MISYLKGTVADITKGSNRFILTLEVNQIGYEIQILPRVSGQLPPSGEIAQIFTHQQVKEDQIVLYGFGSATERDLFRLLTSVSGVGAQLAIALLDTLGLPDLVQAIVGGNTRILAKTPGVGTKTAERLALELKSKLSQWRQQEGLTTSVAAGVPAAIQEEVEMVLLAMGYTGAEVLQALQTLSQDSNLAKKSNADDWIKEAITYLSR
ncbi:MAG: Holliday junction branch migration protein RuvA [Oscillatoriales cyanobacterium]|uniref:Holliday junction branch migration complex subunit RuvA n=1 Tax=Microcoleus anatoxicus PTRS2 TaxID=2705321 RepID=A0ABU8YJB2_9CYAN|nr:MAG: Holliday junction branch migration protein RuvA [Oscillatoriales cyanobacterium]TAD97143.1 MAG: Holliday junction branch migration protein RuvA [Oscillatoriales cyanobacterium]TAE04511.1 MAG: Holliday junction branch migration protein RuvA [Oscillatoriales cyanobacterium]TAF04945.1 MAG: Holliday junction branch migration protein RuvA [Oscillatoriales cyanobacterium]TAF46891.1 MAG: Holliday junction branch migration protein RuvA [Oscillatoriales cyanobacterium]